jgi:hypothetical protein
MCYSHPVSFCGLGFVTHREVDALLGGGAAGSRQRRRLVDRGWLPEAPLIFADRRRVAIYPEFALAALVVSGSAVEGFRHPVELAARTAQRLYESRAYRLFHSSLANALSEVSVEDVVGFARRANELDSDVFGAWRDEVLECADSLKKIGVHLEALPARITEVGNFYVVDVEGQPEAHPVEDAPQLLELGAFVTRDRVSVASAVRDFLLPVPEIAVITAAEAAIDEEEEFARMLFDGLQDRVRVLPHLGAAREPIDSRGFAIEMPWDLLVGSNSMSRTHDQ